MKLAEDYLLQCELQGTPSKAEIICTQIELPTMQHQVFWIDYLQKTGANPDAWIYWLAYDDELDVDSIAKQLDDHGNWPLQVGNAYFGPWSMRHESSSELWKPTGLERREVWTGFRSTDPTPISPLKWVLQQLLQPTYMQMSGSVCGLHNHLYSSMAFPRKQVPMRIEFATALYPRTNSVREFRTSVVTIYGRSDSDRANYAGQTRKEDLNLAFRILRYTAQHPGEIGALVLFAIKFTYLRVMRRSAPTEEWRVHSTSEANTEP